MEDSILNNDITEKFELISSRLFNIKHCFNLFIYTLQNASFDENSVEIITFGIILKEYFNQTKNIYNNLENELGISN